MISTTHRSIVIILLLSCTIGCKKTASVTNLTFENNQGIPVNVDVYASQSDYINSKNVLIHTEVPANGTVDVPATKLTQGTWYYTDVYTADYSYTNWVDDDNFIIGSDSATPRRFKYNTASSIIVATTMQTNARLSLLGGTGASSRWKAYDALDLQSNASIWSSLTAGQQYAEVQINKDHTGTCFYNSGGAAVSISFSFGAVDSYPVYDLLPADISFNFFMTNTTVNPDPGVSLHTPTSIDTAVVLLNGNLYRMARE